MRHGGSRASACALLALMLAPGVAAGPAGIADQAGDANGVNGAWHSASLLGVAAEGARDLLGGDPTGEGAATPGSLAPADVRFASISTEYESVPVGADGVDHRATAVVIAIRTEEPPDLPVYTTRTPLRLEVIAQVVPPGQPVKRPQDPVQNVGYVDCLMAFTGVVDSRGGAKAEWWRWESCGEPGAGPAVAGATASIDGSTLTLRYPLAGFDAVGRAYLAEGATMHRWAAGTEVAGKAIDVTRRGPDFVIGSDMPPDVPCTRDCP